MPEITYDPEVKILSIHLKSGKVFDSDVQDNCVIDYDKKGNIINIDVLEVNLGKILAINKEKPLIKLKR